MGRVPPNVVFIHGAGQAGADAWPQQAAADEEGWFFLPREGVADDARTDRPRILALLSETRGGHVVAHSYGANATLLAAQADPNLVLSLVSSSRPASTWRADNRPSRTTSQR